MKKRMSKKQRSEVALEKFLKTPEHYRLEQAVIRCAKRLVNAQRTPRTNDTINMPLWKAIDRLLAFEKENH